ncbi:haloalkane dehalogenase [Rhodococcus sp. KBW08]|uniref:haloalkane dehalogenase n=1 Tax=Rhodococcus TaxID=1827 RepID=UPI000BB3D299|nr:MULTISPECIES: haloalkane dehalogenase [Rhodococcus]PBI96535.1 Haloalkane dehalogenase [Rhodococcus erythropolis]RQO44335.1 haloalkane dehalogenase [Rhodococcus sp. KBW08]
MAAISVLDSTMAYNSCGAGTPFVLIHGNPTSSHLWRKILPDIGNLGHALAPDLIGMGASGKPAIDYGFLDSARYLDAWFDEMKIDDVVLVGHDWGGALALDWAARHPDRVRGVAFFETILRPMTWDEHFPGDARARVEALRAPGTGETKVLDENFFLEIALHRTVLGALPETDADAYRAPYPSPESRRPLLAWPRSFPIEGTPAEVTARVSAYSQWLATSSEVPKLLLTFSGPAELLMIGPDEVAWCRSNITNLEVIQCGPAGHLAPEDQPGAITAALTEWTQRHRLSPRVT